MRSLVGDDVMAAEVAMFTPSMVSPASCSSSSSASAGHAVPPTDPVNSTVTCSTSSPRFAAYT